MKIISIVCCCFILINNCVAQPDTNESLYINTLNTIKTKRTIKKEILSHFCSNKYRRIIFNKKYFKKNKFSFCLYENIVDSSFFHINSYNDTIKKYMKDYNIKKSNNISNSISNKIDFENSSIIDYNDTLSPFLVVLSKVYDNYLCAGIFLKNYYNQIDFYSSSRVEILFILDENKKIIKTIFSSIIIN